MQPYTRQVLVECSGIEIGMSSVRICEMHGCVRVCHARCPECAPEGIVAEGSLAERGDPDGSAAEGNVGEGS